MELQIKNLCKNYGKKEALKSVDLNLTEGVYGLLGPNGAGKSTMMNILTGNLTQSAGKILLDGKEIRSMGKEFYECIGYMPQQQVFYNGFTVEHFLYYIASLRGLSKAVAKERMDWALGLLGLLDVRHRTIRSLSGGMRQRLLLAQAILGDPDILILDEPTAGLDPRQRIAVRNLIAEIAEHRIILISTHVVSDVEFVANQIVLLSQGEVLCKMPPYELTKQLDGKVWETIVNEQQLQEVRTCGLTAGITRDVAGILVRTVSEEAPARNSIAVRPNLEDVYLHYFGEPDLS